MMEQSITGLVLLFVQDLSLVILRHFCKDKNLINSVERESQTLMGSAGDVMKSS